MPGRSTNEPANYYAVGKQSAKDVEASTFTFFRHLDGTGFEIAEQTESVREGGDGQEVGLRFKTAIDADGQGVCYARPDTSAKLDAWALGADSVGIHPDMPTVATGMLQEHTAVPTSTLPYLTVEQFWADQVERVTNAQITTLTVEWEQGRPLRVTHEFVSGGSAYVPTQTLSPTRESGQPFMYPGATVVIDGAGNSKMTRGRLTIRRNVDTEIRTTGLSREDVVAQNFDVELEGTLKFESATSLYSKAHYAGGTQIPFDLATGSFRLISQFGSGTTMRRKEYGVNQFHYTAARVNKLDPEGRTMYIDFTGVGYKAATHQVYAKTWTASGGAF